ncbi:hypothetical protein ON010_g3838 [Phytophthora cinnamomi]|nr:hypothetical protein ON010_g3838 [Phytophthora cinnamomi]
MSDQAMMEEVLELLAEDSSTGDGRTASTTASSRSASNNSDNQSSLSGFNRSSVTSRDDSVGQGGIENLEVIRVVGTRNEDPNNDCEGEENHPVGTNVPAPHPFGSHSTPCPLVCRVCRQHDLRFLAGSPGMIAAAAAIPGSSCTPVTARLPSTMGQVADLASTPLAPTTRPTPQPPRESAATRKKMRAATGTSTTHVPSTGQRVHVMNGAEFDELRRKLRMQTASRRYRKRKKVRVQAGRKYSQTCSVLVVCFALLWVGRSPTTEDEDPRAAVGAISPPGARSAVEEIPGTLTGITGE